MSHFRFKHRLEIEGRASISVHIEDVPELCAGPCPICMHVRISGMKCKGCGTRFKRRRENRRLDTHSKIVLP